MMEDGDEDLTAVADELDRLLSERGESGAVKSAKTGRAAAPAQRQRQRAPVRDSSLEDVMGALDRLDEQVQGLGGRDDEDDYHRPSPKPRRRNARDDMRHAYDEDRYAPRYAEPDEFHYDDENDDEGYGYERAPAQFGGREQGARANREAAMHIYKDLGRRIDALRAPQEQAMNQVREELGSLRDALGGISRGTSDTVNRQNVELRRLADMVERLRADKKSDQFAKEIRKEVADLKSMVGRTNVEGALQTLEHGYSHILQRLDELSRASVDPRVLRGVTARLNEIEDAFAALPRSEHMIVLEDRVINIAERMEELLQRKGHAEIEPLRAELREVRGFVEQIDIKGLVEGIDDRMKFVSGRLDDLEVLAREQRGLDSRLSAMEERMPEAETFSRLQGRLEDIAGMMADDRARPVDDQHLSQVDRRLDEIVDRLERMEQADPLPSSDAGAFLALEERLETISGKIDSIEKKASRPVPVLDAAAMRNGGSADQGFLAQLQDRLNDLTDRLDQPADTVTTSDLDKLRAEIGSMRASVEAPNSTEALEARISDLAQIVSRGADVTDDARFEQLGVKVAALAEQIETTSARAFGMDQLAPVLDRIESGLEQTRSDVAGIAKKAAEEFIANAPAASSGEYDQAITELQGDLKRLLDAAEGSDERTRNTFDSVKSVLGSLTERMDKLERFEGPVPARMEDEDDDASKVSFAQAAEFAQDSKWAQVFAAKPDPQPVEPEPAVRFEEPTENERPRTRARDRKADFIAAARRAAQAASAETALLEKSQHAPGSDDADEERSKERVGWLRNVLKRDRSRGADDAGDSNGDAPGDATGDPEAEAHASGDELELGMEQISENPDYDDGTPVLPGDRPAPELQTGTSGRKRAILYTAAAVVLLIGTLSVFRMVSGTPDDGEKVAAAAQDSVETASALPAPADATPAQKDLAATASGAAAKSGAGADAGSGVNGSAASAAKSQVAATGAASEPAPGTNSGTNSVTTAQQAASETVLARAADSGSTSSATEAQTPSGVSAGAGQPAGAPVSGTVTAASAPGQSMPEPEVAFAPPSGVAGSFGTKPLDSQGSFSTAGVAGPGTAASLIAGLPPEGVGPMALRSAAASGNPAAEFLVGVKFTEGSGVPADLEKAAVWYQKAAGKGLPPAQYRLASLYEKGRGVEKDLPKARAWYSKAAEAGNAKAMHNLAVLHAEGGGEQPDYAAAAKWFESAANFGVKDSLFNLGILYAGGIGVDKDLVASYKWFAIAADQGDPEAAKRRDDVANMMDQETLANARLAVENFKLKTPLATANKVTVEPDWTDSATLQPQAAQASVKAVANTALVREAQDKLNYLGFDTGTPDGQMGPRTRSAIRAFQRSLGLPETGDVDRKLIEELKSQAI